MTATTDERLTLKDYIEQQANALATFGGGLLESFVLRNGMPFTPISHNYRKGQKRECFMNATHFALENPGWHYCEGYALRPSLGFLIHHAWVVDDEGSAVDLTWDNPEECSYYGVVFDIDTLNAQLREHRVYGLLDHGMLNVNLMEAIDPSLMDYLSDKVKTRKAAFAALKEGDDWD